ncbi:MAG: zinc-binding dehydrogenase [Pseudomonadota bacterium]
MMRENQRIVIHELGASFAECTSIVSEVCGSPGPGEVLIRNHYAGVNGVYDQMMCLNRVEHTTVVPPADTGVEAVGVVEDVGEGVRKSRIGQAVATVNVGGAYRYWQCCPEDSIIPVAKPDPELLALIPSGVSAFLALSKVGNMTSGETVLVTAAAGGLGNIMTQLALRAGNHVIAVCGDGRKAAWLESIGVQRVVNYRSEALREVIESEYPDRLDLAMDSVGGEVFDVLVDNLAPLGRLVVCGYTSDRLPTEAVRSERVYTRLYWKAASVRGFMNYRFAEHAAAARSELVALRQNGKIRPLVDARRFRGLEDVARAVDYLLSGANLGKVVVDLRP